MPEAGPQNSPCRVQRISGAAQCDRNGPKEPLDQIYVGGSKIRAVSFRADRLVPAPGWKSMVDGPASRILPAGDVGDRMKQRGNHRFYSKKRLISAAVVLFALASTAWAAMHAPLTTLRAVCAVTNEQAKDAQPVDFEATVVYSRGYENILFVQDGDDAIFVRPPTTATLTRGDRVLVRGTMQASFHPLVVGATVTQLRHGRSDDQRVEARLHRSAHQDAVSESALLWWEGVQRLHRRHPGQKEYFHTRANRRPWLQIRQAAHLCLLIGQGADGAQGR